MVDLQCFEAYKLIQIIGSCVSIYGEAVSI